MAFSLAVGVALALLRRRALGSRALLLLREGALAARYGAAAATSPVRDVWRRNQQPLLLVGLREAYTSAVVVVLICAVFLPLALLLIIRDLGRLPDADPPPVFKIAQDSATLRFEGPIDRTSVKALLKAFSTMDVVALRIDSPGGQLAWASELAEVVHARGLQVDVDDECGFACTVVLAASPASIVRPDSIVTLFRAPVPVPVEGWKQFDVPVGDPGIDPGLEGSGAVRSSHAGSDPRPLSPG